MTPTLRLALAQFDFPVGDVVGNTERIIAFVSEARDVHGADLVLFEGWFQKVPAQRDDEIVVPLNALEREEDVDGTWRRWCNEALGRDYPPLWRLIDRMLLLEGPGFDIVPGWRWQQEVTLQAANPDRQAMTKPQVLRFVQFFERVSRQALRTLPGIADRHVRLDAMRRPLDALPLS